LKAKYGENYGMGAAIDEAKRASFKAPSVEELKAHYQEKPGYLQWLADRPKVMRGEIEDYPKPGDAA